MAKTTRNRGGRRKPDRPAKGRRIVTERVTIAEHQASHEAREFDLVTAEVVVAKLLMRHWRDRMGQDGAATR